MAGVAKLLLMKELLYAIAPPAIAVSALVYWKLAYVGRRPLSRGVKVIVVAILMWSLLPLVLIAGLYLLAATGGRMGD
jgi:hypothetical protein